jgi:hypothetical protein
MFLSSTSNRKGPSPVFLSNSGAGLAIVLVAVLFGLRCWWRWWRWWRRRWWRRRWLNFRSWRWWWRWWWRRWWTLYSSAETTFSFNAYSLAIVRGYAPFPRCT